MLERNISLFQCPEQREPFTRVEIDEKKTINGVEHVYNARIHCGDKEYSIDSGILRLGAHENESLYNQIWQSDDKISRGTVGERERERLLFMLGRKTLGFLEGKNMIDIGAGLGYRTQAAVQLGGAVVALDSSFKGLKLGMERMAAIPSFLASSGYCRLLSLVISLTIAGSPIRADEILLSAKTGPLVK